MSAIHLGTGEANPLSAVLIARLSVMPPRHSPLPHAQQPAAAPAHDHAMTAAKTAEPAQSTALKAWMSSATKSAVTG